jgi:hypothetical protein
MQLNGNLVFNADATGELQNVFIERLSAAPTFNNAAMGRIYFNTSTALYYFNDGTAWQPFATGGNATLLQQYLNNLIASVGAVVTGSGVWTGVTAFAGDPILASANSLTNALLLLSQAAYGHELLSELGDVNLGSLSSGQFLTYNTTNNKWKNHTLVLADVSDVTATVPDVNLLTGAVEGTGQFLGDAISSLNLSYLSGSSSNIQNQLNNLQPLNANLSNFSSLAGTGFVTQTAANTFVERVLVPPARGFTINNPNGVAGNPTFLLSDNLAALEGLTGAPGFVVYTADGEATLRDLITGSSTRITISNGDGGAASPTIDLAQVVPSVAGTFQKFTSDAYGRVSALAPVTQSDITALVDPVYINVTGDSMTGNLTLTGGATVTGIPTPVNGTDATNKMYVDAMASSLSIHDEVDAATAGVVLPGTVVYSNGTGGVGATLTITPAITAIDNVTLIAGSTRVLIKDQAAPAQNGIYNVTSSGAATVLTRATDADNHIANQVHAGMFVFVTGGSRNASTGWVETNVGSGVGEQINIGTDYQNYIQFSGAGTYTAGTGLYLNGGQFSVAYGAGLGNIPTGEVGIELFAPNAGALSLTTDGRTYTPTLGSLLTLILAPSGGLAQNSTGLYIPVGGVANTMLSNSSVTIDVDSSGSGALALGGTLSILGTSGQGVSTAAATVAGQPVVTINIANASASQKGVSQYDASIFTVTAGNVTLTDGGVVNTKLANSTITVTGSAGTSSVALGSTLGVVGDGNTGITTVSSGGTLTLTNALATNSIVGVAKFAINDFAVDASANVTLQPLPLAKLSTVALSAPTSGQVLTYSNSAAKWKNESIYFLYQSGSPALTHTIAHNLGQKYCSVTVVDATDEVVIPQSITFNDNNTLTVTFTSSINCSVVVLGLALS